MRALVGNAQMSALALAIAATALGTGETPTAAPTAVPTTAPTVDCCETYYVSSGRGFFTGEYVRDGDSFLYQSFGQMPTQTETWTFRRAHTGEWFFDDGYFFSGQSQDTSVCPKSGTYTIRPVIGQVNMTVTCATPTAAPTTVPTAAPTAVPTAAPTAVPTAAPTTVPTAAPTAVPTTAPTSDCCETYYVSGGMPIAKNGEYVRDGDSFLYNLQGLPAGYWGTLRRLPSGEWSFETTGFGLTPSLTTSVCPKSGTYTNEVIDTPQGITVTCATPTAAPTAVPTAAPTTVPTAAPTTVPTTAPTSDCCETYDVSGFGSDADGTYTRTTNLAGDIEWRKGDYRIFDDAGPTADVIHYWDIHDAQSDVLWYVVLPKRCPASGVYNDEELNLADQVRLTIACATPTAAPTTVPTAAPTTVPTAVLTSDCCETYDVSDSGTDADGMYTRTTNSDGEIAWYKGDYIIFNYADDDDGAYHWAIYDAGQSLLLYVRYGLLPERCPASGDYDDNAADPVSLAIACATPTAAPTAVPTSGPTTSSADNIGVILAVSAAVVVALLVAWHLTRKKTTIVI